MKKVYALLTFSAFLFSAAQAQMLFDDCSAHPTNEQMHDEHCAVFALVPVDEATHVSVANGNWSNPSTWNTGTVPGTGAQVLIDSGTTVTYDMVSNAELHWVRVNGTFNFATNINTKMMVTTFVIDPLGYMNIGTAATPVTSTVTAQIIFPDQGPIDITMDPFEFGKGFISHGFLTIYGDYKKTYCAISKNINAGATNLKLAETPAGWRVGDQLVLPGTYGTVTGDYEANSKFHDEVLTITSISGKTIYFTNNATGGTALQYEHKFPVGYGLKLYVADITRNVQFSSENYTTIPIDQRGHLMLMHNMAQSISYASFTGMGRTNKDILATDPVVDSLGNQLSGGENVRGRYAVHIHRAGTNNIAATPTLIKGCSVVDATSWAFVNHEGNATIEDNVAFDFGGSAFVTEDGNELGSFNRNIAIKGRKATTVTDVNVRTLNEDFGFEGNGYWIQSSNVSYSDNIATSCSGDAYKVFSDDAAMPETGRHKIPTANILNPVIAGGQDSIYTAIVPMRLFTGNIAYNCNSALAFWTHMLNNDNVGDFSTVEYDPYTHTIFSIVDNFKFWNMLAAGISVKYSGQVYFKNGLLLGDIDNQFQTSTWISGNPYGGFAFITSTVTGQIVYEGLTVKGWKRGVVAGRTDDLQSWDDAEYDFRTSKIIGGVYSNNLYNIVPEEGTDTYGASEFYKFPKYLEISGAPVFTSVLSDVLPVADFSYNNAGGNAIHFNGVLSADTDPGITTTGAGNGIAAYGWSFGDGTVGYGMDPDHTYNAPGTYSAILTVYDSQGKTGSVTKNIYVTTQAFPNTFSNSGFETGGLASVSKTNSVKANVDAGWLIKSDWQIISGKATIYLSDKWNRPLIQVTKNDHVLRGTIPFSFQAKNLGPGAIGNDLFVEIYGINGEFKDPDVKVMSNVQKWNNNDALFSSTILYSHNYGLASYNWQTFTQNVNFGSGYDYIMVKFYSQGVKVGPAEVQGIDNVCLPCTCQVPQHLFEDELTSSHAMLIWDNMGTNQYEVQYKTTAGATWTTMTIDNTYLELSSLLANTSYTWKVRAFCSGTYTAFSPDRIFITPAAGTACTSPTILSASLITSTKATLNWNKITGALQYQVSYKKSTDIAWTDIMTTGQTLSLTGLTANTTYQWKVKTQCTAGWKDYTSVMTFVTLPLREENVTTAVQSMTISPNPVVDEMQLSFENAIEASLNVRIIDMLGQTVYGQTFIAQEGTVALPLPVSVLPSGIYLLVVSDGDALLQSAKFVKQ